MVMIATDYEILRGVTASGRFKIAMERKPVRVATLISEEKFLENCELVHWKTVFFEDKMHDWDWNDGWFRYYTRVAEVADVVVVYAFEEREPTIKFDPMTGDPMEIEIIKVESKSRKLAGEWVSPGLVITPLRRVEPTNGQ